MFAKDILLKFVSMFFTDVFYNSNIIFPFLESDPHLVSVIFTMHITVSFNKTKKKVNPTLLFSDSKNGCCS